MTSSEFSEELPQRQRPTGERILRASAPPPPVADAGSPFELDNETTKLGPHDRLERKAALRHQDKITL